jgi:hypothetical protein
MMQREQQRKAPGWHRGDRIIDLAHQPDFIADEVKFAAAAAGRYDCVHYHRLRTPDSRNTDRLKQVVFERKREEF